MLFRWRTVVDRATNGDAVWEGLPAGLVCAHMRGLGNKIQFFDDGRCGAWFRDVWHETPDDLAAALALVADEVKGPPPGGIDRIIRAVSVWGAMAAALHREGESSLSFRSDDPNPIAWFPSGPTPQPRWFGDQSPHVREGWPVKP